MAWPDFYLCGVIMFHRCIVHIYIQLYLTMQVYRNWQDLRPDADLPDYNLNQGIPVVHVV